MGHEGRTLRWETKVGARRTDFINESIFVKRHLCKSYKPQFKLKESKMIKSCRKNDLFLATVYINLRSSAEVFCKKAYLKILQISLENTCVGISFYQSCRLCRLCNFIKRRLQHRCFPVKYAKFILQNTSCAIDQKKQSSQTELC